MKPVKLLLLGRPECGLCEEFEQELRAHSDAARCDIECADVDSQPEWQRRYGLKIPILLADDGMLICATRMDADALSEFLRPR